MSATITPDLIDFLRSQTRSNFAQSLIAQYERRGSLSPAQIAAAERMQAQAAERAAQRAAAPVAVPVDPGFYLLDGTVYKVKASRAGNLYAVARVDGSWEYRGAPARCGITPDHRVTAEQAAAHGVETGICIFCNAELDDADGLGKIVGVGPVCARKHLGMTQRQLAARLGAAEAPVAAVAEPVVAPVSLPDGWLKIARRAARRGMLEGVLPTAQEELCIRHACDEIGPEGLYMDGELFGEMGACYDL